MEIAGIVFVSFMLALMAMLGFVRLFACSAADADLISTEDYKEFLRSCGEQDTEENRRCFNDFCLR